NPRISRRSVEIFEGSQWRHSSLSPLQERARPHTISQIPPSPETGLDRYDASGAVDDVPPPSLYDTREPLDDGIRNAVDSDGSQLIGEFEEKMRELIDEWRSLEHV
ncbi:hypothetical protein DQ04_04741000, partial [Trypanosoma grayi]|uniref:hypothetical protein n=1 Tax=Trypanosoma grayi TaxID=71804 RepID=UPI0004F4BE6E